MSPRAEASSHCVICGSNEDVEQNHVGGRNHVAWFTMPFCRKHHDQFHALLRSAGVDLTYATDDQERILCGLKAISIAQWTLYERLQSLNSQVKNERQNIPV